MGMFDTINGRQIKCFTWVSLHNNEISYHGGDLKYYGIGDEVPYKKPHYNYGKNFIILDINRFPELSDMTYFDYEYVLHVIIDGKVENSFENKMGNIDWTIVENVVGYTGELLNINSSEDLLNYLNAQRKYWQEYKKINGQWYKLFAKLSNIAHGFFRLEKDSEERKTRKENFDKIHKLLKEEEEKIKPKINALSKEFSKWYINTSDINDLINLGDYISAYHTELKAKRNSTKTCVDTIKKLLNEDSTLYDRYIKWQESDEDIKNFKPDKH